jgi:hypothetical protein
MRNKNVLYFSIFNNIIFLVGMILLNKNDSLLSLAEIVLLFLLMLFSPIIIIWLIFRKFKLNNKEIELLEDNH